MLSRGYDYGFNGWDEQPLPYTDRLRVRDDRMERAIETARRNSAGYVLFEIGLVLAVPLVIATVVTLLLNAAGIAAAY